MYRKDLTGKRFGKLKVISFAYMKDNHSYWNCECDCGTKKILLGKKLPKIKSCGCLSKESSSVNLKKLWRTGVFSREKLSSFKDGRTKWFQTHPNEKRLYQVWIGMRRRAGGNRFKKDINDRHAKTYLHLNVAKEWEDWLVFYDWALKNGWKPGLTIDRINNEKGYSPDNCRWVSRAENNRNRRCVKKYLYKGEYLTLAQIAQKTGTLEKRLYNRIKNYGYSIEDAVNTPVKSGKNWVPTKRFFIP